MQNDFNTPESSETMSLRSQLMSPNPERLRAHAADLGGHVVDEIYEVGGTVSPKDFPS